MSNALRLDHEPEAPVIRTAHDYVFRRHVFIDARPAAAPTSFLAAAAKTLALWRRRRDTRRHLAALDMRGLADVGLDATARNREIVKYFWQA